MAEAEEIGPLTARIGMRVGQRMGQRMGQRIGAQGQNMAKFGKQTFNKAKPRNFKMTNIKPKPRTAKPRNNMGRGLMRNNLMRTRLFKLNQMRMPMRTLNVKPWGGFGGARNMLIKPIKSAKMYSRRFVDKMKKMTQSGMNYLERRFGKGFAEKVGLVGRLTARTLKFGMYMWIALAFADAFRDVIDISMYGADCGRSIMVIAANLLTMPLGGVAQAAIWQFEETPLPAFIDPQQRGHEQYMKEGLRDFEHDIGKKVNEFMEKPEVKGWLEQIVATLEPMVDSIGQVLENVRITDSGKFDGVQSKLDLTGDGKLVKTSLPQVGLLPQLDLEDVKTAFHTPVKYLVDTSTENDPNNDPDEMMSLGEYAQMMKEDPLKVPGAFAADFFGAYLGPNEDLCDEEHMGGVETEFDVELD